MLPLLDEAYIKTGKMKLVFKEYPVVNGDLSVVASLTAQCAADQGKFWEMNEWLFANRETWATQDALDQVKLAARELGLDGEVFDKCFDEQTAIQRIVEDFQEGQSFDIRGTPGFVVNGHLLPGLLPIEDFKRLIDILIQEAETGALPEGVVTVTPSPTPDTSFDAEEHGSPGSDDAPVTIVEFTDYQCPFCEQYFTETQAQVMKEFVDTGKVKYIVKDFPLNEIHPQAQAAAEASECAAQQDKFWEMHDKLFASQADWAGKEDAAGIFKQYAADLELDADKFAACLDSGEMKAEVEADLNEGISAGVTGTPAFFINGQLLSGAQPFEAFQQVIEQMLQAAGEQ